MLNDKSKHLISPSKLKGIPDEILKNFRINDNNLEESINKAFSYLNSKEVEEIKFGVFLIRIYFDKIIKIDEEFYEKGKKIDYHIDKFIEKGIIPLVGKILNNETNIDILSELILALVYLTCYDTKKNGYEYIKDFISPTYLEVYYKLINIGDNEISINLYKFLRNCIIESDDFAKGIFSKENFIKLCIKKYLEPIKSKKLEQEAKIENIFFLLSFSKLSNLFNEKQKNTFYKIYEKLLEFNQLEPNILMNVIISLKFFFCLDKSKEKVIFNIIKKNNYDIFDKLFFTLNEIMSKDENSDEIDKIIYNISLFTINFILLAEEKDIIILLQQTQLLNFIEAFYDKAYLKIIKNSLLEILVMLSHSTPRVVINMVNGRENFLHNIIKKTLTSNNFDIKSKGIEIVFNMLSLNSLDINIALFRAEIIDQLIICNLVDEEEPNCLKNILKGILFFINSIKCLQNQYKIEIINNFIKIGITNGLENNNIRFNEEHIYLINQIKENIKNILNYNENNISEKNINNCDLMFNSKQTKINDNFNNLL